MSFHGIRYAVDMKDDRQYALTFIHGLLADITTYNAAGEIGFQTNETCRMMDDRALPNGNKLAYEVTFGPQGRMLEKQAMELDASTPFPPHHPNGADIARQKSDFMEEGFDKRIRGNNPFSGVDTSRTRPSFERPQARNAEPEEGNGGDVNPPQRPSRQFPGQKDNTGTAVTRRQPPATNGRMSVPDKQLDELLTKYSEDLTAKAASGRLSPVIGRDDERQLMKQYLLRKKKSSINLIGDSGTGKTEMFNALALDIVKGDVPEDLKDARVLSIDIQGMNEGAKFRGQFEERLLPVLRGLKERGGYFQGKKIILAIDEIHSAFASGAAEGAANAGQLMLPYLSGEELSCIGATTPDMYKKHIEGKALDRRFQVLKIDSLDDKATKQTLKGLNETYQKHHRLKEPYSDDLIDYIVNTSNTYIPSGRKQPDKALGVMDASGSIARMAGRDHVTKNDVARAVAAEAKLKAEFVNQNDTERLLTLERELPNRVLGQKDATDAITAAVYSARAGLNDPNKPSMAFAFLGPTGVGKTELGKALAEFLFGSSDDDRFIKVDMGEYGEKHTGSRLTGAPPGFVGFDDDTSVFERVRNNPRSVVLFDEIEKAAPEVFNNLLAILNDGKTTDSKGRVIDFTNTVIIMTSNKGSDKVYDTLKGSKFGFSVAGQDRAAKDAEEQKALQSNYDMAKLELFKPEIVNRIEELGGFVIFKPLNEDVAKKLLARELDTVSERLRSNPKGLMLKGATIEVGEKVREALFEKGFNKMFGARPLKKVVQKYIAQPLSYDLLQQRESLADKTVKIVIDEIDTNNPRNLKARFVEVAAPVPATLTDVTPANDDKAEAPAAPKKKTGGPQI